MKPKLFEKHLFLGAFVVTFVKCLYSPSVLDLVLACTCIVASFYASFQAKGTEKKQADQYDALMGSIKELQKSHQDILDRVVETRSNAAVQNAFKRF